MGRQLQRFAVVLSRSRITAQSAQSDRQAEVKKGWLAIELEMQGLFINIDGLPKALHSDD